MARSGHPRPPTFGFFQRMISFANRRSSAVEEHADESGSGVIFSAPRASAARISRSDRIMQAPRQAHPVVLALSRGGSPLSQPPEGVQSRLAWFSDRHERFRWEEN